MTPDLHPFARGARRAAAALAASLSVAPALAGDILTFDFTLNPASSGLTGNLGVTVDTTGTLVGNWVAATNPTGTRTKPGIFGSFGSTENVPVDTTLGGGVAGPLDSPGAGVLRLTLNTGTNTASLSGFSIDFVSAAPILLPATVDLAFDSFRTRAPDSTYLGIPVSLPIGDVSVTQFAGVQAAPAAGTITPAGPGAYDVTIAAVLDVTGSFEILANAVELPPTPVPIVFQAHVVVTGTTATITSVVPVQLSETQKPGTKLPEFPLDLPTILPAGNTAHVLMNLVLDAIGFDLDATLTLDGSGVLVPGCYADCNESGSLTVADFGCFQGKYVLGDLYADCNASGTLTVADFGCFQGQYVLGCP
ncbi:MAG: hypothetical protein ACKVU4_07015 [Phycisphaerales bacterium]